MILNTYVENEVSSYPCFNYYKNVHKVHYANVRVIVSLHQQRKYSFRC